MASPVIESVGHVRNDTGTTTHNVTVPTGIVSGDLLLLIAGIDRTPRVISGMPAGWSLISQVADAESALEVEIWRKTADGSEVNFTYTTDSNAQSVNRCYRISGWDSGTPPEAALVGSPDALGASADPPNLAPSFGGRETRWIAFALSDGTSFDVSYPANYSDNQFVENAAGVDMIVSSRALEASSENPGTYTLSAADQWLAGTIAVPAAPVAAERPPHSPAFVVGGLQTRGMVDLRL